jgi:glutathione S-transferase
MARPWSGIPWPSPNTLPSTIANIWPTDALPPVHGHAAPAAEMHSGFAEGLARFGGPFLAGRKFTAVDAFFAPVVYRFRTYGVDLNGAAAGYMPTMLDHPALCEWEAAALAEDFREAAYDADLTKTGTVTADLRVPVATK